MLPRAPVFTVVVRENRVIIRSYATRPRRGRGVYVVRLSGALLEGRGCPNQLAPARPEFPEGFPWPEKVARTGLFGRSCERDLGERRRRRFFGLGPRLAARNEPHHGNAKTLDDDSTRSGSPLHDSFPP